MSSAREKFGPLSPARSTSFGASTPLASPLSTDRALRRQRRSPIIMVANLKGGVGKTTLTANLAAYFSANGKRVLYNVDYQGSYV